MKKNLLLIFAFLAMTFLAGAQVYLLQEGFEGTDLPTGWTVIDNDGDGNVWYVLNNSQSSSPDGFVVHSGAGHITSASYNGSALTPDNWLITPAVPLTSDAILTFWVAGQDQAWAAEHFSVYLSTTGATVADFTTTLLYDQVATGVMTEYTVNLAQYTGQTVYIAFRHHNVSDMFRLNLDDVEITAAPTTPTITVTPATMSFNTVVGDAVTKTAMVNAFSLTTGVTAATAAPFFVSTDSVSFGATATLPQAGGTLYVQYNPSTVGIDSGVVTLSSTGATDLAISVRGQAVTLATLPYSQDFEDASENANWCFYHNGTNLWNIGTAANNTTDGATSLYVSNDNGATNAYDNTSESTTWAWRDINFGNYAEYSFSFDFRGMGESSSYDYLKIYLGPPAEVQNSASSSGSTIQGASLIGSLYGQSDWVHYTATLDNTFHGTQRLYLLWWNDGGSGTNPPAAIDNITITGTNCAKPSAPVVSNVAVHTADVAFSPALPGDYAWEYALCTGTETTADVTPVAVADTVFSLDNLTDGTAYRLYIRTNCGDEFSNWSAAANFETDPTCTSPQNLTVSHVAGTSAIVTWNDALLGATSYTFAYTEAGTENWITVEATSGNQVVLSGLDPLTTYEVSVTSVCDEGSAPAAVKVFTTRCLAGGEFAIGDGTGTSSYLPSYSFYNYGYSQQIFLASEMNGATAITSIAMNMANLSQQRNYKIYLAHTSETSLTAGWITPTNAQLVYTGPQTLTTGWNTFDFNTPFNYNGTDNLLVVFVDSTGSYVSGNSWYTHSTTSSMARYTYQDGSAYSLTPPTSNGTALSVRNNIVFGGNCDSTATCFAPNLYATFATSDAVTLTWVPGYQESEWEVEYTTDDTIWTSVGTVTESPYTVSNLTPNTEYTFRMRSVCGAGDNSNWTTIDAKTTCVGIDSLPFTEGFDTYGTGTTVYPDCWDRINTANNNCPYITSTNYQSTGSLYFYAGTSNTYNLAVTPPFESTIAVNQLMATFMYMGSNSTDRLVVGVMSNPADANTFVPVDTVYPGATPNEWTERTVFFNTYMGEGHHIAFKNEYTSTYGYAYIDNLVVEEIPNCVRPTSVTATSSVTDTVVVAWAAGPTATTWEIVYGPTGFNPDSLDENAVVIPGVTENPYAIDGLTTGVVYDFYVRTDCGADGFSEWSSLPGTGAPYTFQMDVTGTGSVTACGITITDDGGMSGNYSNSCEYTLTIYPTEADSTISISGTFAGEGNYDYLEIYEGTTTSGMMMVHINSTMNGGSSGDVITFGPYVSELGAITLRFHSDGSVNYPGFVAQATCVALPTCLKPASLAVSGTAGNSVTLGWTGGSDVSSWNIVYGPTGFDPNSTTGTVVPAGTNPFTVDNLTVGTTYDFYVQADCGSGDVSLWTGPVSATPGAYNMSVTGSNTITTCDMVIYDDGGATGNYSSSSDSYLTIYPETPGNLIAVQGTSATESSWDYLYIYDGTSASGTLLFTANGSNVTIPELVSSTGPLTLYFHSDGSMTYAGFELTVSCISNTCPKPTNLTVSNVGNTSATVSWTPGGSETSWIVEHKLSTASNWTVATATSTSYTLTGLSGLTTYDVRVKADCGDETSQYATTSFTTPNCAASDACDYTFVLGDGYGDGWNDAYLTIEQNGTVVATLEAIDHDLEETPTTDNVTVSLCDGIPTTLVWHAGSYDDEISITLNGPDGTQLFTVTDLEENYSSPLFTFTTECNGSGPGPEPCATPTGLAASNITSEGATITWNANPNVSSWNIQYGPQNGQLTSATAATNSYAITGLTPGTTYNVQVQAVCDGNNTSDWSAVYSFTTTTGIESWLEGYVTLFPNPANDVVNVQCTMYNVQMSADLHVFDVYGKLVQTVPMTGETTSVNVSGLADGMYFVRVTTEAGMVTKPFVVKR